MGLALTGAGLYLPRARSAVRAMVHLRGKTVLITGGSRGLGLAMGREFVARGARWRFARAMSKNWSGPAPIWFVLEDRYWRCPVTWPTSGRANGGGRPRAFRDD